MSRPAGAIPHTTACTTASICLWELKNYVPHDRPANAGLPAAQPVMEETVKNDTMTLRDFEMPMTGDLLPLTEVPDEAFSAGLMGPGFGIRPTDGAVYALHGEVSLQNIEHYLPKAKEMTMEWMLGSIYVVEEIAITLLLLLLFLAASKWLERVVLR